MLKFLFSHEGRINRKQYWIVHLPILVFFVAGEFLLKKWEMIKVLFLIFFLWPLLVIQIKRWHDRNKSGTWVLLNFVPFIGPLWSAVELGFFPSKNENNRFDKSYRDENRFLECVECNYSINYYDFINDKLICPQCGGYLKER
jgi:uncharacterized membrane protein YhaH (DUF805 family)